MYPFKENSFAIRNAWYVAAFRDGITRDLLSRRILNEPVVLYRTEAGEAVAVGGRCPHRHFPLGESCLKGDEIQCAYHGIRFGPDGKCTDIPSQPGFVPKTYAIPKYPLVEHGMWAWIWMGDANLADPALLPNLDAIGHDGEGLHPTPFYHNEINARYQLLNENLLDLTHIGFLHGTNIGTEENATTPEELTEDGDILRSRRYIRNAEPPNAIKELHHIHHPVDRVVGMDFHVPSLHAGIGDFLYPEDHPKAGESIGGSRVFHAVTPATHRSCHYFFGISAADPAQIAVMKDYLKPVIDEDIFASEEIEKMLAIVGENPREILTQGDRNVTRGRHKMQKMMDAEHLLQPNP